MDYINFNNKILDKFDIKEFLNNNNKSVVIKIIIFLIIFILLLEETIRLTLFVFKYDYTQDYGNLLKNLCGYEYMEYETSRFQLSDMIKNKNIQLDFDKYNKTYHFLIILILSIIISIIISFMTVYIINDTLFEFKDFNNDDFKYDLNSNKLLSTIIHGIKILFLLFIFAIIPTEIILQLDTNKSINPFISNIIDYRIYIFILIILLLIKLPFINNIQLLYLNKNTSISYFTYYLYIIIFCLIFYFISNIIYIYKNKEYNNDNYNKNFLDEYEIDNDIISSYLKKIIGAFDFEKFFLNNKSKINNILIKDFSNYVFYFIITLIFLMIIMYVFIPYLSNYINIFGDNDYDIIYNTLFIPLLIFVIISIILIATYEYNTYINKYILYDINALYIKDIKNINDIFNNILENDKSYKNTSYSVPKNIVNPINLVLFKNIFKTNLLNSYDKRHDVESLFTNNNEPIDLTPEFTYKSLQEDKEDFIDYVKLKEYNIAYYLYNKKYNTNIFYKTNKCESINNDVIINILINTIIPNIDNDDIDNINIINNVRNTLKNELLNAIYNVNIFGYNYSGTKKLKYNNDYDNNNKLENNINIIKNNNDDINKEKEILYSTYNDLIESVIDEYILYLKDNIILTKNLIYNLEKCMDDTKDISNLENEILLDNYINYNSKIKELLNNDNIKTINIKKDFIDKSLVLFKNTFDKLNIIYSSLDNDRKQFKLSSLIINNYNKVNPYQKYNNKKLIEVKPKLINNEYDMKIIYKDFYDIVELLKDIILLINDLLTNDLNYINKDNKTAYIINNLNIIKNSIEKSKLLYNSDKYKELLNLYNKYELNIPPKLINEIVELNDIYIIIYNSIYNDKNYTNYKNNINIEEFKLIEINLLNNIKDFENNIINKKDYKEPTELVKELYSKSLINNSKSIGILSPFLFSVYISSIIIIFILV